MKTFFSLAVAASTICGCGANRDASALKAEPAAKPEFEQFVSIGVKAMDVDAYKMLVAGYAKFSRSEPGNDLYAAYQSIDDPTQFQVHEIWRKDADHAAHVAAPEFKTYSDQANAFFAAPPVKQRLAP